MLGLGLTLASGNMFNKLLLDMFPGANSGVSTCLISSAFRNDWLVRVVRLNDYEEALIKADLNLTSPRISLNSPIVGSSSTFGDFITNQTVAVIEIKNQRLGGVNFTQTNPTNAPTIVNNGALNTINGIPAFKFNGFQTMIRPSEPTITDGHGVVIKMTLQLKQTQYKGLAAFPGVMLLSSAQTLSGISRWGTYGDSPQPANTELEINTPYILEMQGSASTGGVFYLNGNPNGTYSKSEGQGSGHLGGISGQNPQFCFTTLVKYPTALANRQSFYNQVFKRY